jgi:hypothetical protein
MTACIGEPISWPRLELFASGARDPEIAAHVAACPACAHCLDGLRTDVVALPPLVMPQPRARRRMRWIAPAMAFAAAALIVLVIVRRGDEPGRDDVVRVKGIGEVTLGLVRERGGVIRDDVTTFTAGDRWKILVTCPPSATGAVWIDAAVFDAGVVDRPLAPTQVACGNRVAVPGAFTITGTRMNLVCVRVSPLPTAATPGDAGVACKRLLPE